MNDDLERRAAAFVRECQREIGWAAFVYPTKAGGVSIICPQMDMAQLGTHLMEAGEALFNGPEG